jgi:hydroxypyruvate isomerase
MLTRRHIVGSAAGLALPAQSEAPRTVRKGPLKQGIARGVFRRPANPMSFEEQCRIAARLGVLGIDLVGEKEWPTMKQFGLLPLMAPGGGNIPDGLNRVEFHERIDATMRKNIDLAKAAGAPNVITFSGNRRGMSDDEGLANCVKFLNNIKRYAEKQGVTICMELLNSRVDHPDYMCDHTRWGAEMCRQVNSPRVKLLYDIYHMQIMEGDIIRTIRNNIQWIGHFHTAGNPGRHEFDLDSQELNYRGIAKAIADLKFEGYISHEYTPLRDPVTSLDEMMRILEV